LKYFVYKYGVVQFSDSESCVYIKHYLNEGSSTNIVCVTGNTASEDDDIPKRGPKRKRLLLDDPAGKRRSARVSSSWQCALVDN